MQTHRRPDLREPIRALLTQLSGAVAEGGSIPLTDLVSAVVGAKLTTDVRARLGARGDVTFARRANEAIRFSNDGPETRIELKRFDIEIPRRLGGNGSFVDGRVTLRFDRAETLIARKFLLSVKLQSIALDDSRVVVTMESSIFDQCFELV